MTDIAKLKDKYIAIYGFEGCSAEELRQIEDALGVRLPDDFKIISEFYSGGFLGGISHHEIAAHGEATNIVQETLRIRAATGLSQDYVVLAEPSGSLIVLNVTRPPSVIWCDAVEVNKLNTMEFVNEPDSWSSYASFFEYLLSHEDEE
ncbi:MULTISPECIES: SMI1/KNR4 family protein [unclassified Pseudomonas]|uniref:SMI1/KNR4 family protein n=1 Tax=unclassified Pseudomonas TaxID=196821 RepID=UPI000D33FF14|nr:MULTISPECIES: SMI1/KNR4 family protein [unclassified Pseudomonas]RAU45523.1 SMI1/KNR4 family protein [Pseudomonas sp. RIT 409]RAU53093.1 SMI1/KNR4 family protein [Pseudomonas sp. RIT 412]